MSRSLNIGIKEERRPSRFSYDVSLLANSGPYAEAHISLDGLLQGLIADPDERAKETKRFRLLLVHECEQAARWLELQNSGGDFHTARIAENDIRAEACAKAISALDDLISIDADQPYFLRHSFVAGLASTVPDPKDINTWLPNSNLEDGGEHFEVLGRTKQFVEQQFSYRTGLFELDRVLKGARDDLAKWTSKSPTPWNWLGNLYVEPPLSRRSKSRITKESKGDLGVAVLGLSVSLSAHLRLLTAKEFRTNRWVGTPVPTIGQPRWEIVADYVNCTFPSMSPETAESLKQRWHNLSKNRRISIHNWTGAVIRQPQIINK